MAAPMIINEVLDEERLNEVQELISSYMNNSAVEKVVQRHESSGDDSSKHDSSRCESLGNDSSGYDSLKRDSSMHESTVCDSSGARNFTPALGKGNAPETENSPCRAPEEMSALSIKYPDDGLKKYKICIIENGTIIIPEDRSKFYLDEKEDGCVIKELTEDCIEETSGANTCKSGDASIENSCAENPKTSETRNETSFQNKDFLPKTEKAKKKVPDSQGKAPGPEKFDNDVMNKLLDYYRKFNERQLGLAVNEDQPGYRPSTEAPTPVVCDNDIIKEAVLRVGQKEEAGEAIKEPTLVEDPDEDLMEPESKPHLEIKFDEDYEDEQEQLRQAEKAEFSAMFDNLSQSFDEDFWMYGANFIEKALEKKIDGDKKEKARRDRWGQDDILKLVDMLSTNYECVDYHTEGSWNSGAYVAHYEDYRDDLMYQLEELYEGDYKNHVYEETLFDRLKRAPASDDRQELRALVAENSYFHRTGKPLPRVYQGGDELLVVTDAIKYFFSFEWLWSVYEQWFGRKMHHCKNSSEAASVSWLTWLFSFPKIRSLTGWLQRSFKLAGTGKPIYKHVEYQSTDFVDWHEKYENEAQDKRILKNRKGRNANEETILAVDEEHGLPRSGLSTIQVDDSYTRYPNPDILNGLDGNKDDCILYLDA